ncbi:MAG: hypothetical protein MUE54_00805 [Anaerolineae bacterium]|nr:hypothetical protein [Anaerolineae bacterium]
MKITPPQQKIIAVLCLIVLLGLLYTQYLRPTPLTLDTVIPNTPEQGETRILFALESDTLLFPTQCLNANWDMSNTRGIYINEAGVAAPEKATFCHLPAPNGVFARLRVILPDDTSITYDFKVRVLAYDHIFLALGLLIIGIGLFLIVGDMRHQRLLWWTLGIISLFSIAFMVGIMLITSGRFMDKKPTVWDDALMFARYAHHLDQTGIWSWNADESPVFGMTELVYGALVYANTSTHTDTSPIQLVQDTSHQYGVLWVIFGILFVLMAVLSPKNRYHPALSLMVIGLLLFGVSAHSNLLHHFTSGMGTTTVLLYAIGYIALAQWAKHTPMLIAYIVTGFIGGLGFIVRPDMMLFTVCVPIALFIFAKTPKERRYSIIMGIITLLTLGAQLLFTRAYFGVALPLPFFAKSGGIYDGFLANQYVSVAIDQLGTYAYSNRYLILLIIIGFISHPKGFMKRMSAVEWGLLVGMMGYIGYYAVFVTQIMPEYQRFYYPTLPIIIWLACIGVLALIERLTQIIPLVWGLLTRQIRFGIVFCIMVMCVIGVSGTLYEAHQFVYQHQNTYYPPHDARWYKLAQFARVDNITVATTEVGAVAVANFSWRVIDMAGLNDTHFALDGFSADKLLDDYRPDLLYLPYPDYIEMTEAIVTHPHFARDYTYFTAGQIRLPMGVAVRNDSPHYSELLQIAQP